MRRIFFGGTFDPIHLGHTRLALECQRQLSAQVMFVPCGEPPHKNQPQASANFRLTMVELAVAELNHAVAQEQFSTELMEINSAKPSFTISTLQALRDRFPDDDLFWLIGMDSLVNLASWQRWRELTDFANLLVVNRPGWQFPCEGLVADWVTGKLKTVDQCARLGGVILLETTPLNIASHIVKQQLQYVDGGKYLLPESVRDFIIAQRLYH